MMSYWLNLTNVWPQNELEPLWSDVQVMFWNMFPEVTPILMSLMFSNVMAYFELRFETCSMFSENITGEPISSLMTKYRFSAM